jgi:O-antigen/teichoic acid export membrane protein
MSRRRALDLGTRIGARGLAAGFQAITLLLIARIEGPESFGVFAIALSVGYVVSGVVGLGAGVRVLRIAGEPEGDHLASALFLTRVIGSILTLSSTAALAVVFDSFTPLLAAGALAASDLMVEYSQSLMAGRGHQALSSAMVVVQRALPAAGVLVAVALDTSSYGWFSLAVCIVLALSVIYPIAVWAPPSNVLDVVRSSGGYWAGSIVANLRQLEPISVGAVAGAGASGGYAIASRIGNPLVIVTSSLQTVFVPDLAKKKGTDAFDDSFRKLLTLSGAYGVLLLLLSLPIAHLVAVFLGSEYRDAEILIAAMVASIGIGAITGAYQSRFIALGEPGTSAAIIGVASVFGIALILVVGSALGADLLWTVPLATQTVLAAAMIVVSRRARPDPHAPEGGRTSAEG